MIVHEAWHTWQAFSMTIIKYISIWASFIGLFQANIIHSRTLCANNNLRKKRPLSAIIKPMVGAFPKPWGLRWGAIGSQVWPRILKTSPTHWLNPMIWWIKPIHNDHFLNLNITQLVTKAYEWKGSYVYSSKRREKRSSWWSSFCSIGQDIISLMFLLGFLFFGKIFTTW